MRPSRSRFRALVVVLAGVGQAVWAGQLSVQITVPVEGYRLVRSAYEVVWLDDGSVVTTVHAAHWIETVGGENDGDRRRVAERSVTSRTSGEPDAGRYTRPRATVRTVAPSTRERTVTVVYASDVGYADLPRLAELEPILTTGTAEAIVETARAAGASTEALVRAAEAESAAADAAHGDLLDARTREGNSETVGDPVVVATGRVELRFPDLALDVGPASASLDRVHRSGAAAGGSFGPGWHFSLDSRIVFGSSTQAEAAASAAERALVSLHDPEHGAVARAHADARASIAERELRRSRADAAARDAMELAGALGAVTYSGVGRAEVRAEIARVARRASELAASYRAESAALSGQISALRGAADDGARSVVSAATASLRVRIDALSREAGRADANRERNLAYATARLPPSAAEAGNDSVVVVAPDGRPVRFVRRTGPSAGTAGGRARETGEGRAPTAPDLGLVAAEPTTDRLLALPDGTFRLETSDGQRRLYGVHGELRRIADANGNGVRLEYDGGGRLVRVVDSRGRELALVRDSEGRVTEVRAPEQTVYAYRYDEVGRLASVTDPAGDTTRFEYDGPPAEPRVRRVLRPDGSSREYAYELVRGEWRAVRTRDEEGAVERFAYPTPGRTDYEDPNGAVTSYRFDADNRVVEVHHPDGSRAERRYDEGGNVVELRSPGGTTTRSIWDSRGNRTSVVYPDRTSEAWTYDAAGRMTSHTGRDGARTTRRYDASGNVLAVEYPDGTAERFTRVASGTAAGAPLTHTDRRGNVTRYEYDRHGFVSRVTDSEGPVGSFTNDTLGRVVSATDGTGATTRYAYRRDGRLARVEGPLDRIVVFEYSDRKDLVAVAEDGVVTRATYDRRHLITTVTDGAGGQRRYEYDAGGRPVALEARAAFRVEWDYDRRGNLVRERIPATRAERRFEYDADGRLVREIDASGIATDYEYGADAGLTRVIRSGGGVSVDDRFDRRHGGLLESHTDANGARWTSAYDPRSRRVVVRGPGGTLVSETAYDPYGLPVSVTDGAGRTTTYRYDLRGRLVQTQTADGATTDYAYDAADRLVRRTDASGAEWRFEYDARGRPTGTVNPDGTRRVFGYGRGTAMRSWTDETGRTVSVERDGAGRIVASVDPAGHRTTYGWSPIGGLASVTDPTGRTTRYAYDGGGRMVAAWDPAGEATRFAYDAVGRLVRRTDPTGLTLEYGYDALGRPTSVALGGVRQAVYRYDAAGNVLETTDAMGRRHEYRFDEFGRPTGEINAFGARRRYEYDAAGRVESAVAFTGERTEIAYTDGGYVTRAHASSGELTSYAYDAVGRLVAADNDVDRLRFAYDALGRVVRVTGARSGTDVEYRYDAAGRRTVRWDHATGRRVDYVYDARGLLIRIDDGASGSVALAYDAAGRRTSVEAPNGVTEETVYDPAGRAAANTVRDATGTVIHGVAYVRDAAGRRVFDVSHDAEVTSYAYDPLGRLSEARYPFNGDKRLSDYERFVELGAIARAPLANRATVADPSPRSGSRPDGAWYRSSLDLSPAEAAALESAYRTIHPLRRPRTSFTHPVWTEAFEYNDAGDRTEWRNGWGSVAYTYAPDGRLVSAGAVSFRFDEAGNLVERSGPAGATRYEYGSAGRATRVVAPEATVSYGYDALGRRSYRTVTGPDREVGPAPGVLRKPTGPPAQWTTSYRYDGGGFIVSSRSHDVGPAHGGLAKRPAAPGGRSLPLRGHESRAPGFAARDVSGSGVEYTELGIGRRVVAVTGPEGPLYLHSDRHGTVRLATDARGLVARTYAYDAFGVTLAGEHDPAQPYAYSGKAGDPDSGLIDFGYRDYAPLLARFTTVDPVRSGTNWYVYARSDPVNFVDPWGLTAISDEVAATELGGTRFVGVSVVPVSAFDTATGAVVRLRVPEPPALTDPVPDYRFSGGWGPREPIPFADLSTGRILYTSPFHTGSDTAAPVGTPQVSVADGRVVSSGFDVNVGHYVFVDHERDYRSGYYHLSDAGLHAPGQEVRRGETIGFTGNSGIMSTGPHAHNELRYAGDRYRLNLEELIHDR